MRCRPNLRSKTVPQLKFIFQLTFVFNPSYQTKPKKKKILMSKHSRIPCDKCSVAIISTAVLNLHWQINMKVCH